MAKKTEDTIFTLEYVSASLQTLQENYYRNSPSTNTLLIQENMERILGLIDHLRK